MPIFKSCQDPALTALKDFGYNVVQLPRADLLPTQLLYKSGRKLKRLGDLTSVFVPLPDGPAAPPILPDQPGPDIEGKRSADVSIDIGLDILGGLISALGGSTLGISMAYSQAKSVEFKFSATKRGETDLLLVDQFLASASINKYARAAREMLDSDKVYLVTSVIKSDSISVSAKGESNQSLKVEVPVIQNAIGANLEVVGDAEQATVVTYKGAVPLTFGIQAVRLNFVGDEYQRFQPVDAGAIAAEAALEGLDRDDMLGDEE